MNYLYLYIMAKLTEYPTPVDFKYILALDGTRKMYRRI